MICSGRSSRRRTPRVWEGGRTWTRSATASGLDQSVVSRVEQGLGNPTARTLALLARALDASLALVGRKAG